MIVKKNERLLGRLLGLVVLLTVGWAGSATARETLTEVKISADLRRVVIKTSGEVGEYKAFQLDRPPRLVVDITGVAPGKVPRTFKPEQNGGLKIDVSESKSGVHVVLDFCGAGVPSYNVRRMESHLIVFLDDWTPATVTPPSVGSGRKNEKTPAAAATQPAVSREKATPQPLTADQASDLTIKSADFSNGLIVLKVADKRHPDRLYRIDLAVNVELRRLVHAGIHPMPGAEGIVPKHEPQRAPGAVGPEVPPRVGPRKTAGPVRMSAGQGFLPGQRSSYGAPGLAQATAMGPTRWPRRGPNSGGLQQKDASTVADRIPRMSASDKARSVLQAYRNSPLLRVESCAFDPKKGTPVLASPSPNR